MKKVITFFKNRMLTHWQTTLVGILVYVGFAWYHKGKIDFSEFTSYIALVPTIVLLLMKDFKKDESK